MSRTPTLAEHVAGLRLLVATVRVLAPKYVVPIEKMKRSRHHKFPWDLLNISGKGAVKGKALQKGWLPLLARALEARQAAPSMATAVSAIQRVYIGKSRMGPALLQALETVVAEYGKSLPAAEVTTLRTSHATVRREVALQSAKRRASPGPRLRHGSPFPSVAAAQEAAIKALRLGTTAQVVSQETGLSYMAIRLLREENGIPDRRRKAAEEAAK